jgi:hypothetical protein
MAVDLKAYASEIEDQIKQIHEDLAPLENGTMTIGEREGNGPWRDVTQETIKHHKVGRASAPSSERFGCLFLEIRVVMAVVGL